MRGVTTRQELLRIITEPIAPRRDSGISISDRRVVKLQRLIASSTLICGRLQAQPSDLWVLRYIWDTEDQPEVLNSIVQDAIDKAPKSDPDLPHPRSRSRESARPREPAPIWTESAKG